MNRSSLPNLRHEVKPQVLGISWIQLMFTCVNKKKEAKFGIYYMGQGNDLCEIGSPPSSLAVEMGRAIFEGENMALRVHKYLTSSIFP